MAISPKTKYPGQTDITTDPAGYPEGAAQNITTTGDGTGTPFEKDWVNDWFGFSQAVLDLAGVSPSGTPEKVGASQLLDALTANASAGRMTANTTLNFTSSMTAAQIQVLIDAVPRNLNGYTLTLQFGDGTYTLNAIIEVPNFTGGSLNILGKSTEIAVQAATKSVVLNSSSLYCIRVVRSSATVSIKGLQMYCSSATANASAIALSDNTSVLVQYNSLKALGTTGGSSAVITSNTDCQAYDNYFANAENAIYSNVSSEVASKGNLLVGADETKYVHRVFGGKITETDAPPTGALTATRIVSAGGRITDSLGNTYAEKGKVNNAVWGSIDTDGSILQAGSGSWTASRNSAGNYQLNITEAGDYLVYTQMSTYSLTTGFDIYVASSVTGIFSNNVASNIITFIHEPTDTPTDAKFFFTAIKL